jgi:hypothetical protein
MVGQSCPACGRALDERWYLQRVAIQDSHIYRGIAAWVCNRALPGGVRCQHATPRDAPSGSPFARAFAEVAANWNASHTFADAG